MNYRTVAAISASGERTERSSATKANRVATYPCA